MNNYNETEKEKQTKPKKTTKEKRLIACYIAMYCFVAGAASSLPGMFARDSYDNDIRKLDDKQNAVYEQFMESEEFSDSFKEDFTKISDDYTSGKISYEEFDERVKHLNSVEYAQEVLESSNNNEFKSQVEVIDQKKEERREKYNSNIVPKISLGAVGTGMAACIGALISSVVYGIKEDKEEKRKKKTNKIKHVLIDEKTTYYAYDHVDTKTPTNYEAESNEDTLTK